MESFRKGTEFGDEHSLVGTAIEISGCGAAYSTHTRRFRCGRQIPCDQRSRLHQILHRDHSAIPNLFGTLSVDQSRRTIAHMRFLQIARSWQGFEVRMRLLICRFKKMKYSSRLQ